MIKLSHGTLRGRRPTERGLLARVMRYFDRAIRALPPKDQAKALTAENDFWSLITTLALVPVEQSPELKVRLRGAIAKRELLEADGGVLAPAEVAALLHISRQAVGKRRIAGKLLGIEGPRGYLYLPKTQTWLRLFRKEHDPVHFGRTHQTRFDAAAGEFGVLYVARRVAGAFVETLPGSATLVERLPRSPGRSRRNPLHLAPRPDPTACRTVRAYRAPFSRTRELGQVLAVGLGHRSGHPREAPVPCLRRRLGRQSRQDRVPGRSLGTRGSGGLWG
jgi:hypothetical protein